MNWKPSAESNRLHDDAVARWARLSTRELQAARRGFHKINNGCSYVCRLCCAELARRTPANADDADEGRG